ncbi:hypothetical protein BH23PLA1_BH23PLA1_23510 [soil metagenome]
MHQRIIEAEVEHEPAPTRGVAASGSMWTRKYQVLAELPPANLEDRPPLAEMEVLQWHGLHQLLEVENLEHRSPADDGSVGRGRWTTRQGSN